MSPANTPTRFFLPLFSFFFFFSKSFSLLPSPPWRVLDDMQSNKMLADPATPPLESSSPRLQDEERTLFVGDLPADCSPSEVSGLFSSFERPIADVQIKTIRHSTSPFSYAFVKFGERKDAAEVFEMATGRGSTPVAALSLRGCAVRLGWARRNRRLHISNCKSEARGSDALTL